MAHNTILFDSARIALHRARAAVKSTEHAFLRERALGDIVLRLQSVTRTFDKSLLISPFTCAPNTAPGLSAQTSGFFDVPPQSLDLVASLLHLHLEDDLPGALRTIHQSLRPDGLFLGALFGERTLHELRHCLLQAESEHCTGVQARIIPFAEIRALGGLLQSAGFALPVVDVDRVVVRYSSLRSLMHDLRGMGESNPLAGPIRPLRRDVLRRTEELYQKRYGDRHGRLAASFEIIHLCGWAPHESQQKPLKPGSAQVSLKEVLGPHSRKVPLEK